MHSVEAAAAAVLARVGRLATEIVALREARGRVLAEDVASPRALPGFDNSAMDGYAVRAGELPSTFPIVAQIGAGDAVPSDFFRRNVFLSFQEDAMGIRDRALIGVDRLLWGSDYPHTESTFPRSRVILERILDGVSRAERRQITASNTARLYRFDSALAS